MVLLQSVRSFSVSLVIRVGDADGRMKGVSIPWEAYASYANAPRQDHPSATPSASPPTLAPSDPLSRGSTPQGVGAAATGAGAVDGLAEARRMMASDSVPTTPGREGEAGLSFATLCDLISEGRAADVPGVQKIPDQLNVSRLFRPRRGVSQAMERQHGGADDRNYPPRSRYYRRAPNHGNNNAPPHTVPLQCSTTHPSRPHPPPPTWPSSAQASHPRPLHPR